MLLVLMVLILQTIVKTREGRPIKIDNNTISGANFTANARIHASILSLYDNMRLKEPKIEERFNLVSCRFKN
jgi:hypothetical protein